MSPLRARWEQVIHAVLCKPVFLVIAAVTLSVGIAALVAAATLLHALVIGPLPFPHDQQLVAYGQRIGQGAGRMISPVAYDTIGNVDSITSRGIAGPPSAVNVTYGYRAHLLRGQRVDAGFLATLGLAPLPVNARPGSVPGVWVTHALWMTLMHADHRVVGQPLTVDGVRLKVAGVLPVDYRFGGNIDLLLPWKPVGPVERNASNMMAVARLAPTHTQAAFARDVTERIAARPGYPGDRAGAYGVTALHQVLTAQARPMGWLFASCAGVLLSLAGVNVSNLMRTRVLERAYDMAIREALGVAGGWHESPRIVEGVVIGVVATLAGLGMGGLLVDALQGSIPASWRLSALPITVGWQVVVLACVASAVVVTLASLAASRPLRTEDIVRERLAVDGRPSADRDARRVRGIFVLMQAALASALLLPAVATLEKLWRFEHEPSGFQASHALVMELQPDALAYPGVRDFQRFSALLRARAVSLPGVDHVGLTSYLPVGKGFVMPFRRADGSRAMLRYGLMTPGAAQALGLEKRSGRWLADTDDAGAEPVAMVNDAYVMSLAGGDVGSWVTPASSLSPNVPRRIVGVVADTRGDDAGTAPSPTVFIPLAQANDASFAYLRHIMRFYAVVRGPMVDASTGIAFRDVVHQMAPYVASGEPRMLDAVRREAADAPRRIALLLSILAMPAALLAGVGLYSVQAIEVRTRRRDIALNAALGTHPAALLGRVLLRGMCMGWVGVAAGLLGASLLRAWWLGAAITPQAFAGALLCMLVVTLGATAVPACRALAIPPWRILRGEV